MNINNKRINQLISLFIELNDDEQIDVIKYCLTKMINTDKSLNTIKDRQQLSKIVEFTRKLNELDDTHKAANYILMSILDGENKVVQKYNVEVNVSLYTLTLKEEVMSMYPMVDYDAAYELAVNAIDKMKDKVK